MNTSKVIWQDWIDVLHARGIAGVMAIFLEAVSPLAVAGAQLIFVGEPLFSLLIPSQKMSAVTDLLEDTHNYMDFIAALKQENKI